jgi:hypothetical protein
MEKLAEIARQKKEAFLLARTNKADFDTMKRLGTEYADAIAAWHKVRFPKKKFNKPSVGYLIRAL